MKKRGVYYIPSTNGIWVVTNVNYYEDMFSSPFSIVNCITETGRYDKCLITSDQFKNFVWIGDF